MVVVGNGGIALDMVAGMRGVDVCWVVKHDGIGDAFFDGECGVFLEEELSEAPEATPAASDEFVWHIGAQSISSLNTSDHRHSWHSDHSKNNNITYMPKQRESMPPVVSAWNAVASDKPKLPQRRVSWIDDSENVKGSAADDSQTKL